MTAGKLRSLVIALVVLLSTLMLVQSHGANAASDVTAIRFGVHGERTRIVIDVTESVDVHARAEVDPARVILDLPDVRWNLRASAGARPRGLATAVRYGRLGDNRSRIVIDTKQAVKITAQMTLPPRGDIQHYRFVLDVEPYAARPSTASRKEPPKAQARARRESTPRADPTKTPPPEITAPKAATPNSAASQTTSPKPAPSPKQAISQKQAAAAKPTTAPKKPERETAAIDTAKLLRAPIPVARPPNPPAMGIAARSLPVIAIDAGHGGIDPGAISESGVYEKDITLLMAKELAAILKATGRYKPVLIRNSDKFIRLRERIGAAREGSADIFLSLHADSISDPKFSGGSVYTLSETASDEEAAMLARKENKADIIGGTDLSTHDEIVTSILIDLAQRDTNNKSIDLADLLVTELGKVTKLVRKNRRHAGFVVLKSPDTPSVLIELGYLSNATDAANLVRPDHRKKLAHAISIAIDRYFSKARQSL